MRASWHRRLVPLTLVTTALLFLSVSEGWTRQTNGVWALIDGGATKPPVRKHSTLVYDPGMKRLVLFGGDKSASGGAYSDVWAFQLPCGPWVQLFADDATDCSSTSRPCRRHGHAATYVPGSSPTMFIHGGRGENDCLLDDTWQLTLTGTPTWTRLSASSNMPDRWHHAMVYYNQPTIFGGETLPGCVGQQGIGQCDTWIFSNGQWINRGGDTGGSGTCGDCVPDYRYQHSLIVDTSNFRMVTFGGVYENGVGTSNVWWTDNIPHTCGEEPPSNFTWFNLGGVPAGYSRALHTATFDPIGQRMVVIGGYSSDPPNGIVSAVTSLRLVTPYSGSDWSTLTPTGSGPGAIAEHAAAYDPDGDRIIVFGGVDQNGTFRNDLWALQFADDTTPPNTTTDLHITSYTTSPRTVTLYWSLAGDDGTSGRASSYSVRKRLGAEITESNWSTSTIVDDWVLGTTDHIVVTGLSGNGYWYFALKARDEVCNTSGVSNNDCIKFSPSPLTLCGGGKPTPEQAGNGPASELAITAVRSNPFSEGGAEVSFTLASAAPATLAVFDAAGRQVEVQDLSRLGPGPNTVQIGARLAAGHYWVRIDQADRSATRDVIVIH